MLASVIFLIMVSVTSITEQLCKQKLEDEWTDFESEKRTVEPLPRNGREDEGNKGHLILGKYDELSKLNSVNNNQMLTAAVAATASSLSGCGEATAKDCEWYPGQMEQMPPKKKHRRSFSIPGESKSDVGLELHHHHHHDDHSTQQPQSVPSTAVVRPVAVRPMHQTIPKSRASSTEFADDVIVVIPSRSHSEPSPYLSISGSFSGFSHRSSSCLVTDGSLTTSLSGTTGSLAHSGLPKSGFPLGADVSSDAVFRLFPASNVHESSTRKESMKSAIGKDLIQFKDLSSGSSANSEMTIRCQRSPALKARMLQTPERKTGLKRRRDEDRPKLDFFKMIETAYDYRHCRCSISQRTGSNRANSNVDTSSPDRSLVNQKQTIDASSSPCYLLDSNELLEKSPPSPFVSLHSRFFDEEGEDEQTCFLDRNAAVEYNQLKENRTNMVTATRDERILDVGSEFDLDQIENN